jgi:F-type H+-transporting ATPase subunit a
VKHLTNFIILCFFLITSNLSAESSKSSEKSFVDIIMHHIGDSHELHFFNYTDKNNVNHSFSIPLPIILFNNNKFDIFMSSEFNHNDDGSEVVNINNKKFSKFHETIYQLNYGEKKLLFNENHEVINASKPLDLSITKNVFSMFISLLLLLLIFVSSGFKAKKENITIPNGFLSFTEPLVVFVKDNIAIPNIGVKNHKKFLPYLLTVFFFIFINNLLGLIPSGANLTGNIAVTLTLSFFTLFITNISGNKNYWKHIFMPSVPLVLYPIMVPIEIIGVITKPFALMIRLFANITAGHIIILSLISLIFIFKSIFIAPISVGFVLFMNILELLVALLQAYIFTLLSALFIGQAVAEHH